MDDKEKIESQSGQLHHTPKCTRRVQFDGGKKGIHNMYNRFVDTYQRYELSSVSVSNSLVTEMSLLCQLCYRNLMSLLDPFLCKASPWV